MVCVQCKMHLLRAFVVLYVNDSPAQVAVRVVVMMGDDMVSGLVI